MKILNLATAYGMTPAQFQEEVTASMAVMGVELAEKEGSVGAEWTVDVGDKKVTITVEVD